MGIHQTRKPRAPKEQTVPEPTALSTGSANNSEKRFYNLKEASDYTRLKAFTLKRHVKLPENNAGHLKRVRGTKTRGWIFTKSELDRFMAYLESTAACSVEYKNSVRLDDHDIEEAAKNIWKEHHDSIIKSRRGRLR